ncbi:MAG: T9SS type A sorting domain-containing protein [Fidelibacterota bacterium]
MNREQPMVANLGYGSSRVSRSYKESSDTLICGNGWTIQAIDFSDSNNIQVLSEIKLSGSVYDIYVDSCFSYVATTSGLAIINISSPNSMELLCDWNEMGESDSFLKVIYKDNFIYLCGFNSIYLLDVNDRENPILIDTSPLSGDIPTGIAIFENQLYVSTYDGLNIDIFDISSSTDLIYFNHLSIGTIVSTLKIYNNYLYIVTSQSIKIYQLEIGNIPSIISTNDFSPFFIGDVSVSIDKIFASLIFTGSDYNPGILVIDSSNPYDLELVEYIEFIWDISFTFFKCNIDHSPNSLFVSVGFGIWQLSISDSTNIYTYSFNPTFGGHPTTMSYDNEIVYLTTGYSGIWLIDVSSPDDPYVLSNTILLPHLPTSIVASNNVICFSADSLLFIAELDVNNSVTILDTINIEHPMQKGFISNGYLFGLQPNIGFFIININDPSHGVIVYQYDAPYCTNFFVDNTNNVVYLVDTQSNLLHFISMENISSPYELTQNLFYNNITNVYTEDSLLVVCSNNEVSKYLNLNPNETDPIFLSSISINTYQKLQTIFPFIYCGDLYIINNTDSSSLVISDSIDIHYNWVVNDRFIYCADYGLTIYQNTLPPHLNIQQPNIYPKNIDIQIFPNPTNSAVNIYINSTSSNVQSVRIYNLIGREIFSFGSDFRNFDHRQLTWDGKDNSGKEISSGMYYCVVRTSAKIYSQKVLVLK